MDYSALFDKALNTFGAMQVKPETLQLMELLDKENIRNFLEIGVAEGCTFYLWTMLCKADGLKLGIDAPNGPWGKNGQRNYYEMAIIKQRLLSLKPNIDIFLGNSHHTYVQEWAKEKIGDNQLDFLFIDGDHAYDGVKQDYLYYSQFVKPKGIIAIHDIKDSPKHAGVGCTVHKFWNELDEEKTEIISDTAEWGGIGIIRKKRKP